MAFPEFIKSFIDTASTSLPGVVGAILVFIVG